MNDDEQADDFLADEPDPRGCRLGVALCLLSVVVVLLVCCGVGWAVLR